MKTSHEIPRVIVDTDLGSCMDDLFMLDLAARMHRAGKIDLCAVMADRPDGSDPEGRGEFLKFADRYLASLGLPDTPLAKAEPLAAAQKAFTPYWTLASSSGAADADALLPANRTDAALAALPNAVTLYRKLLAAAPDKSVVICSIGFLNNLMALLANDRELIAAKVKELRVMVGCFDEATAPDGLNGAEYNAAGDPAATKAVLEQWPSPVVVTPWEVGLKLEYRPEWVLEDFAPGTSNPAMRAAYLAWQLGDKAHACSVNNLWDLMTLLPLLDGDAVAPLSETGRISVDGHGRTTFVADPSGDRRYQLASGMDADAVMRRLRGVFRTPELRKRAYLLDMDGVMVDNCRYHVLGWLELARRHGGRLTEAEAIEWMGAPGRDYVTRMLGGPVPPDRLAALMKEMSGIYQDLYRPHVAARAGLVEFLKGAKAAGIPCAVVTGGPVSNIDFILDGLKIREYFSYIVDVSQYERGKPAPDCYLLAAAKLGVEPRDCVVFEDAVNGIKAALAGGMRVVAFTGTHPLKTLEETGPDRIVSTFDEIGRL